MPTRSPVHMVMLSPASADPTIVLQTLVYKSFSNLTNNEQLVADGNESIGGLNKRPDLHEYLQSFDLR